MFQDDIMQGCLEACKLKIFAWVWCYQGGSSLACGGQIREAVSQRPLFRPARQKCLHLFNLIQTKKTCPTESGSSPEELPVLTGFMYEL